MDSPSSLLRDISPPPSRSLKQKKWSELPAVSVDENATPAAVEAGKAFVDDHLTYFSRHLGAAVRPVVFNETKMPMDEFAELYVRNQHPHGHHFVVHQHNHPVAGVHYDLRLQFSKSSSISFAMPYGLPGNPYSRRQGRMAIETRVHNLWNHLIESASHLTGSLLIWDTGEYEVVSSTSSRPEPKSTDDEASDIDVNKEPENEKLIQAFQNHSIHLRLHGVRLPPGYTISLRLPSDDFGGIRPPGTARKRRKKAAVRATSVDLTDDESDTATVGSATSSRFSTPSIADTDETAMALASEDEEDAQTRVNNAYPGSTNSIGSIHQRRWFVTLDKQNSGFVKEGGKWVRGKLKSSKRKPIGQVDDPSGADTSCLGGFEPFIVRGAEFEKSVVTGRLSKEVMDDEGVEGFVERKRWKPILE